jgi:hypothetical protein
MRDLDLGGRVVSFFFFIILGLFSLWAATYFWHWVWMPWYPIFEKFLAGFFMMLFLIIWVVSWILAPISAIKEMPANKELIDEQEP